MGVRFQWVRGSAQAFLNLPERLADQIYGELGDAMAVIVESAVQNAREFTAERGTRTSLGGGRIETSAMIGAIKGEVETKAKQVIGKFGFIGQQEDYFLYQTVTGFNHWLSAEFIEPTFALRDAEQIAIGDLGAAIQAAIRNVRL